MNIVMVHDDVPFVSVVIPTYNRRELLRDAITSLFNQSYRRDRYEIIVVDNSSSDGTDEMMYTLQKKSPCPLRYYRKENEGPGASRNFGIEKAKGDIVAFTDSDCVADQNWLKNGVANITDGVGIVQGKTLPNPDQPQRKLQHTMKILSEDAYYQTCNIFYRKEALDLAGGFAPEFCGLNFFGRQTGGEDTDLAWRVKKQEWNSVFADDSVVYHHVFPLTSLRAVIRSMRLHVIGTIARLVKKHPKLRDDIFYRKVFKSKQRAYFYMLLLSMFPGMSIHWGFFFLGLPYVIKLLSVSFYRRPIRTYHRGLALFALIILLELIHSVVSICSSLIHRTIIL